MAASKSASAKEKRQARAFLRGKGIASNDIPPDMFASTAVKMGKSFGELLKLIATLKMGGQGQGQSPKAKQLV